MSELPSDKNETVETENSDSPLSAGTEVTTTILAGTNKVGTSIAVLNTASFFGLTGLKKIPLLGAAVTAGFVLMEVGEHAVEGNYKLAAGAFAAGTAETLGAVVGFGAGDILREGTRQVLIRAYPEEEMTAIEKSDIRVLAEAGIDLVTPDEEPSVAKEASENPKIKAEFANMANPPAEEHSQHQVAFLSAATKTDNTKTFLPSQKDVQDLERIADLDISPL